MIVINVNYIISLYLLQIALRLQANKSVLRVVGGYDGDLKIHQHVVRMELKLNIVMKPLVLVQFQHICTATVIAPVWVLTAAHCIDDLERIILVLPSNRSQGVIRYGSLVPWINESFSDIIALAKHPSFRRFDTMNVLSMKNDIGLMKTTPIHLNRYGKLSAMDYKTLIGHVTDATGYGLTSKGDEWLVDTLVLRKALQVFKVLINKCTLENYQLLYPALCLSRRCGHVSSLCAGDSGGPLLHPSGVVAVNSISDVIDCYPHLIKTNRNWFAIATPVSPYIAWIKNHIQKMGRE